MGPTEIKTLRQELHLTQQGLARALGVQLAAVGRWECGLRTPSPLAIRAMELLLEVNRLRQWPGQEFQDSPDDAPELPPTQSTARR
jgi:DNA-binding transcriptional regulator YiaG